MSRPSKAIVSPAWMAKSTVVVKDSLPRGAVIRFACDQKRLPRRVTPEEMFVRNTLDLE